MNSIEISFSEYDNLGHRASSAIRCINVTEYDFEMNNYKHISENNKASI